MMEAGRELDVLIAEKVMGWTYTTFPDGVCPHIKHWYEGEQYVLMKPFSTHISAAWLVVEALEKKGYALALQGPGSTDMNEYYRQFERWTADFYPSSSRTEAQADTAPLAICLAALAAVGYHFDRKESGT